MRHITCSILHISSRKEGYEYTYAAGYILCQRKREIRSVFIALSLYKIARLQPIPQAGGNSRLGWRSEPHRSRRSLISPSIKAVNKNSDLTCRVQIPEPPWIDLLYIREAKHRKLFSKRVASVCRNKCTGDAWGGSECKRTTYRASKIL